jgi:hypothetical protein
MEPNNPINGLSIRVFISYRRNDTPHAAGRIGDPSCLGLASGLYFDTHPFNVMSRFCETVGKTAEQPLSTRSASRPGAIRDIETTINHLTFTRFDEACSIFPMVL